MSRDAARADYRWWTPIDTRWNDCDAYGHVNNAVYYAWIDTAVTRMLHAKGVIAPAAPSIGLVVTGGCDFHAPVEFPHAVDAGVRVARIGGTSIRYEVGLFGAGGDAAVATGFFVHVHVDRETRRPAPVSPAIRAALADLVV